MRKKYTYAALVLLLAAFSAVYIVQKNTAAHAFLNKTDRIDLAIEREVRLTRDPATGDVPRERLLAAQAYRDSRMASRDFRVNGAVPGITWQERGPNNVGGRTRGLIFDLGDAANGYKKVWAGGIAGGLWWCNDITASVPTWNKVNDLMDNLAITAFAQSAAAPQIIYAGTGEGWFNSDAVRGLGIYKSINGGATWTRLVSTENFKYVQDLQIDKDGHLFASVRQFAGTDPGGILRSSDGGATWTQVLGSLNGGFGSSARGGDLELAANGDLYATLGTTGSNGGVYRSPYVANSTGTVGNWLMITPSATGSILTAVPNPAIWQRIELATAPSDANIVYALFQGAGSNNCTSIQQYNAGTNSWTVRTVPNILDQNTTPTVNFTRGQAWYDLIAAVDPNNAQSLYVGGVDALRSDNGGDTWTQMTAWSLFQATGFSSAQNVHADHHAIVYAPGSSGRAMWGTDGGIDYTENANVGVGKPTFLDKNNGYNVTQFYAVAMHPTNPNYFLTGAQDNGSHKYTGPGIQPGIPVTGGDGAFCHIDQDNPLVQITSFVYNNYYVSLDGGNSFASRSFGNTGDFINPTDYDDAGNKLYASLDANRYLRWEDPATGGSTTTQVSCAAFGGAEVTAVTVSKNVAERVYFGLTNGAIVRVESAGTGATVTGTVIKTPVAGTSISSIAIDGANEDHLLATVSNYGAVSVWETTNAQSNMPTWTATEGNLPDMPVRWVLFDPRNSDWALIATEMGVWSTDNLNGAATDWQPTNGGLANTRVDMLQLRPSDNLIAAATHGRGFFTAIPQPVAVGPSVTLGFATTSTTAAEQSAATTDCRRYRDYNVTVMPSAAPGATAGITFDVASGGTAIQGLDYDLTTNGNFAAPSLQTSFPAGSTAGRTVTVRVYDDAEVESTESFTLRFTITTGVGFLSGVSSHIFTITDNDVAPTGSTPIATVLSQRAEFSAGNADLYYYNAGGALMARLRNLDAAAWGCTNVEIDRPGGDTAQFWNFNPSNYLMDKTFRIQPATPTAGRYEVTFYYTEAEVVAWQTLTGRNWSEIQLVRVPSSIRNVTPLNPQPDGSASAEVVTPVRGRLGSNYTLTHTFSSGFGGYGAGVPGRRNTLINLTATLQGGDIKLDWSTSSEEGSTFFVVEKSYDGVNFDSIGRVAGAGTKLTPSLYSFIDRDRVELNHYRIRLRHSDGYIAVSNTVFLRNTAAPDRPLLLTNPFGNNIRIRFPRVVTGAAMVSMYDAAGKMVYRNSFAGAANTILTVDVSRLTMVSRAIYLMDVFANGQRYSFKVQKL